MKEILSKLIKKIKKIFRKLDWFQLLSIPVLLVVLLYSVDFTPNKISIGVILPLTGDFGNRSQNHLNGIKLAINHINKMGGIDSVPLSLQLLDSGKINPAEAARDLIYNKKVTSIIGGLTSDETRIIQYISEKAQTPFITGICTHFEITKAANYTFRTITDDEKLFEALIAHSQSKNKIRHPAIIYDQQLYGTESAAKYSEICSQYSQQVTNMISYNKGTVNFKKELDELLQTTPDSLVILAPTSDSALITRQLREMHFTKPILGANMCSSTEFIKLAGIYSESIITTLPFNPRVGGKKADYFLSEYQDQYGETGDADAAFGYEAVMILYSALKSSNGKGGSVLRDALANLHGWDSIVGSGGFDQNGNQVRPAEIAILKDKQTIPVSLEGLF